MKETRLSMGMPITIEVVSFEEAHSVITRAFEYFKAVDERFSTYKSTSEITSINREDIPKEKWSPEMREIFSLAEQTEKDTKGYFNIKRPDGILDPSGIVKGWSIRNAAIILQEEGCSNFFIDVGGDVQTRGHNEEGFEWSVGIRNPFKQREIVKVLYPHGHGVATSGTYVRGQHIYNPYAPHTPITDIVSLTIIGPDVYEADRFATPAFAMGREGIMFIESLKDFEGYLIDSSGIATMTSGFEQYLHV